jgi:hypothetical protein
MAMIAWLKSKEIFMKNSRLFRASALFASIALWLSSCASTGGSRGIATQEQPLTHEQVVLLQEVGVRLLNLAVISNSVHAEGKISKELAARLKQIGVNGEPNSGNSLVIGLVTVFGTSMAAQLGGILVPSSENFASTYGSVTSLGTTAAVISFAGLATGTSLSIGESTGSWTPLRKGDVKKAKTEAEVKQENALAIYRAELAEVEKRYSEIFVLSPAQRAVFSKALRTTANAEAKSAGPNAEKIQIDVPRVLVDAKVISDGTYEAFRKVTEGLQASLRSETALAEVRDGGHFGANVALAKSTLRTYVGWLKETLPNLDETQKKKIRVSIDRAELLIARI